MHKILIIGVRRVFVFNSLFFMIKERFLSILNSKSGRRIANGALWGIFGAVVSRSLTLCLSFVLARILGKEGFGEFGIINSTTAMISSVAGLGIGTTATRYIASLKHTEPDRVGSIIGLSVVLTWLSAFIFGFFIVAFSSSIAKILSAPRLTYLIQISSIAIALGVINSVQISVFMGLEAFKKASLVSSITSILQSVIVVLLAWKLGIYGAVVGLALSSIITVSIYFFTSRKAIKLANLHISYRKIWDECNILIKFSLPAFLSTISYMPIIWLANAFLAKQPDGYGQLGIYNAALQWDVIVQFLPSIISTAALPIMSDKYGQGGNKESFSIMLNVSLISFILVTPLALLIVIFSPSIISAYGASFSNGHLVLSLVVITAVFCSLSSCFGTFIAASGKMWLGFIINSLWGITFLFLGHHMVIYGAEGLAGAKLIAYVLHFIWSLLICFYLVKVHIRRENN